MPEHYWGVFLKVHSCQVFNLKKIYKICKIIHKNKSICHSDFFLYRRYSLYFGFDTNIQTWSYQNRLIYLGSLQTNMHIWGSTTLTAVREKQSGVCYRFPRSYEWDGRVVYGAAKEIMLNMSLVSPCESINPLWGAHLLLKKVFAASHYSRTGGVESRIHEQALTVERRNKQDPLKNKLNYNTLSYDLDYYR